MQSSKNFMLETFAYRMVMYHCSVEINSKVESVAAARKLIADVAERYADGNIDYVDGLSVAYPLWRFSLRMSNTEPVIRLNVENRGDKRLLQEKTKELLQIVRN